MNVFDLTGRNAVVTGASRGIGLAIARGLMVAGARVMITGRTEESVAKGIADLGSGALGHAADVSRESDVARLAAEAEAAMGPVDILVNNAGVNPHYKRTEDTALEEWEAILDVNLTGVFLCTRAFGRGMLARGRGSIVNITSIAAHAGLARTGAYCAAKAGVEALSRSLAMDWAGQGVRVNNVAPGYVATDLTAGLSANDTLRGRIETRTPAGRLAEADEMAGAVIFLASDAASYVTGATLAADGGWTAT
ncbi:SDR family NAD(P)-dependent oxidoreductase [Roseovarius sp.]|uniref:SDR family NAD(P)-dependent oxidoreductase n=1 Tax=Roseovarius sp. TaxID=1486281 RepID=UPI003A96C430